MEETIGYEALFSPEEWADFDPAHWEGDLRDGQHRVTVWYPPGEFEGNDHRHELEYERCGYLGTTTSVDEAKAMARLHEALGARQEMGE